MTDHHRAGLAGPAAAAPPQLGRLHHIVWRWHFYAGLFTAPFLIMLALTGLIMLWTNALFGMNGERTAVPSAGPAIAVSEQAAAAAAAVPGGRVTQYLAPLSGGNAALFRVDAEAGNQAVLVNPHDGAIVGQQPWRAGIYDLVSDIHGSLLIGTLGDRLVETAASLGMVLLVTGVYLWWPRGAGIRAALLPAIPARGRGWWRAVHGTLGLWLVPALLFFLISGLSWAGVWGEKIVQAWNTFPATKWAAPVSDATHASMNHSGAHATHEVPWTLEQTPMPASGSRLGQQALPEGVTPEIDSIAGYAASLGLPGRFQIKYPAGDDGVWTISHDSMSKDGGLPPTDLTLHLDRYTGKVIGAAPYAEYSPYAKAMAWGIALHEGDMGWWNVALNTALCLMILMLSVSGAVMWWRRKPAGLWRLGAPPRPRDPALWRRAVPLALIPALLFPMAGAVLVGFWLLDTLLTRRASPAPAA